MPSSSVLTMFALRIEYIHGLVQDCSNSIANALELPQSYTMPWICHILSWQIRLQPSYYRCLVFHSLPWLAHWWRGAPSTRQDLLPQSAVCDGDPGQHAASSPVQAPLPQPEHPRWHRAIAMATTAIKRLAPGGGALPSESPSLAAVGPCAALLQSFRASIAPTASHCVQQLAHLPLTTTSLCR